MFFYLFAGMNRFEPSPRQNSISSEEEQRTIFLTNAPSYSVSLHRPSEDDGEEKIELEEIETEVSICLETAKDDILECRLQAIVFHFENVLLLLRNKEEVSKLKDAMAISSNSPRTPMAMPQIESILGKNRLSLFKLQTVFFKLSEMGIALFLWSDYFTIGQISTLCKVLGILGYVDVDKLYNMERFRNLPDMRNGMSVVAYETFLEHALRLPRRAVTFVDGKDSVSRCFVRKRTICVGDHHELAKIVS